ncbi:oxidoreductase [Xaviernesmea oryzae]|uniref:Oxidoreductase n=1 Tax=Xaviernesmea oryzae TaxID=464029 RepID=A0A1Q9ARJ5_9HYPH|nr:FAD-binding oxidoreductase [Xaviernesmea oryzae]OLP58008.1 oxidoreductase [Xaviernesmea oryzae]SEL36285.1 Glycine/D-amino acid oxidase [Xaviernesmea oryzae]
MQTLWTLTSHPRPDYTTTGLPSRCDSVIIGAGFTGLTAALHLARAGRSVVVLEAGRLGAGASGTNAGFVVPNFAKADPAAVRARLGNDKADALLSLVGAGGDAVFATIAEEGIDCDGAQTGWLQPAYGDAMARLLQARAQAWQALGRPVEALSAAEVAAETGMSLYSGGLIDRSGGTIHPLNYLFGLAAALTRHGGQLCEHTSVTAVDRAGTGWRVTAGTSQITADSVILATNAFNQGIAGRMGRTGVPLRVYQVATRPVDATVVARIAPHRLPVGDTRQNLFTYRLDRENRLISGGMAVNPVGALSRVGRHVASRLAAELGLPATPGLAAAWTGTAIMTPDFLPRLYRFGEGFFGGIGCNGRGIAMTAQLGRVLAGCALGAPLESQPIPLRQASALPFHRLTPLVASAALIQARLKDRLTRIA